MAAKLSVDNSVLIMTTITILGGGSWGTALAMHLARQGHKIQIWEFMQEQARKMQEERVCPLLPGVILPASITVTSSMQPALSGADMVLIVVPSDKVAATLQSAKPYFSFVPH